MKIQQPARALMRSARVLDGAERWGLLQGIDLAITRGSREAEEEAGHDTFVPTQGEMLDFWFRLRASRSARHQRAAEQRRGRASGVRSRQAGSFFLLCGFLDLQDTSRAARSVRLDASLL
jgi:hypothetical protein